jgi:unsaturated rhamnogalacturonyl hydrolase
VPQLDIDRVAARRSLERLAARASAELPAKKPHWGDAILCDGLIYAARTLGADAPRAAAEEWFAAKLHAGPRLDGWFWFWAAEALPALALHATTGRTDYLEYARRILDAELRTATRTADGGIVPHPPALELWIDVAYFTAPAMAMHARLTDNAAQLEWALDQLAVHSRYLRDERSGLFWHVAYIDQKRHSACFWARGNSWFSIAASQVLAEVAAAPRGERFESKSAGTRDTLAKQLQAIVELQDASGLWHTVIDRADSYLESSAAAGFALALGRALRADLAGLDRNHATAAYANAIRAIMAQINAAGEFTGVSQQTPPGDFNFYNSIERGTAPFGTGVCMMALGEALGG